jgi:hypothetical protein
MARSERKALRVLSRKCIGERRKVEIKQQKRIRRAFYTWAKNNLRLTGCGERTTVSAKAWINESRRKRPKVETARFGGVLAVLLFTN